MKSKSFLEFAGASILAGLCISVGAYVYLAVGGLAGAALFSIGLLTVVHFHALLYTGRVRLSFDRGWASAWELPAILAGNVAGCALAAMVLSSPEAVEAARSIVQARAEASFAEAACRGAGCGFIMTVAVSGAKSGNWWPLLIGVPAFILSGMWHSIADAFYLFEASGWTAESLVPWLGIVLGNFAGGIAAPALRLNQEC